MTREVLLIRLRLLGDIIFTIPALMLIKVHFPGSRVHYVVEEDFRQMGEMLPGADLLTVVPRKMGIRALTLFGREVRRQGIDTVVDFHSGPKSALMTLFTRASQRIGYRTPNRNWAYNHLVPRWAGASPSHSVINQARLLEPLGIGGEEIPAYPRMEVPVEKIGEEVHRFTSMPQTRVILHTGAGNRFRDWGMEKFRALVRRLRSHEIAVALVGSRAEETRRSIQLSREEGAHDFSGKLTLRELFYLIDHSLVYIGADSGPLHLASLTQTPIVALYGPNIPQISGPWRKEKVVILERSMECRPCSQRRCLYDTMRCLSEITVDEVYEAILRFLL